MKRIFCVLLSLSLILGFSACGKAEIPSDSGIDIEYYANLGKIPECEYNLGTDAASLREALTAYAESEEGQDGYFDITESDDGTVCMQTGSYKYYYNSENEADGITAIASFDTAYGFETGEVIVTVKEALSGVNYTEEEVNDDNAFFLFVPIEGTVIRCEYEKNTVLFVFEDNALCAVAVCRNDF